MRPIERQARRSRFAGEQMMKIGLIFGFILLIVAQVVCFAIAGDSPLLQIVLAVPTAAAGCAIFYQLHLENNTAKGNFVLTLDREFAQDAVLTEVLEKIYRNKITACDSIAVVSYLGFFEVINVLLERRAIDLKLIDRLFRMRFFRATMSPQVQKIELLPCHRSYQNIYQLNAEWLSYLEKIGELDTIASYGKFLQDALDEYKVESS